jgi:hypothetical protein
VQRLNVHRYFRPGRPQLVHALHGCDFVPELEPGQLLGEFVARRDNRGAKLMQLL